MIGSKCKQGDGRQLTDHSKTTIKLKSENAPSGRSPAREFGVTKSVIWKIKKDEDAIKLRISQTSENSCNAAKRALIGRYPELEQCLFD